MAGNHSIIPLNQCQYKTNLHLKCEARYCLTPQRKGGWVKLCDNVIGNDYFDLTSKTKITAR